MFTNERATVLLVLLWMAVWHATRIALRDLDMLGIVAAIVVFPLGCLLFAYIVVATFFNASTRKRRAEPMARSFIPVLVAFVGIPIAFKVGLPPTNQERAFRANKGEFKTAADDALRQLRRDDAPQMILPGTWLYNWGEAINDAAQTGYIVDGPQNPDTSQVTFVLGDFGTPLLFVSSDDPTEAWGCSVVVERLEPHWYVCKWGD